MKSIVALLVIFVSYCQAVSYENLILQQWDNFKLEHDKLYESHDERYRYGVFLENLAKINRHNKLHAKGLSSYTMAVNQFADLTDEEFLKRYTIVLSQIGNFTGNGVWEGENDFIIHTPHSHIIDDYLAAEVDWRKEGYVTEVQMQCVPSWSYSATGALEGQWFKSKGKLVALSKQNLNDCCCSEGDRRRKMGELMPLAFKYIIKNEGIDTETSYQCDQSTGGCRFSKENIGATASSLVSVPQGENELKSTVATVGPISIAMHVMTTYKFYSGGIYDDPKCTSKILNHAMLVVGYGSINGKDYWLAKNSWGKTWGESGYIRMIRNKNDQCGVSQAASYPVV